MSSERSVYRRIVRRETHSSRAGLAITVAVILMLLFAAAGVGSVYLIVHPHVWAAFEIGVDRFVGPSTIVRRGSAAAGVVAGVLGILIIVVAIRPGRRPRRRLDGARAAVVVDDKTIARALARSAASAAAVPPGQVVVVVARRRAAVRITPIAGVAVDRDAIAEAVQAGGARYGLSRSPRVAVAAHAVVG